MKLNTVLLALLSLIAVPAFAHHPVPIKWSCGLCTNGTRECDEYEKVNGTWVRGSHRTDACPVRDPRCPRGGSWSSSEWTVWGRNSADAHYECEHGSSQAGGLDGSVLDERQVPAEDLDNGCFPNTTCDGIPSRLLETQPRVLTAVKCEVVECWQ